MKKHATRLTVLKLFSLFILRTFIINVMVHEVHTHILLYIYIYMYIYTMVDTLYIFKKYSLKKVTNIQEGQADL